MVCMNVETASVSQKALHWFRTSARQEKTSPEGGEGEKNSLVMCKASSLLQ